MRERELHASVVAFLTYALPKECVFHHSPNEGRRGWQAQRDLKSSGVKSGWPDIEVIYGGRAFFIELKAPKKYTTPQQKAVHAELRNAGCDVFVAKSLIEVAMALETWAIPLSAKVAA